MYICVDEDLTMLRVNQLCLPEEHDVLDRIFA